MHRQNSKSKINGKILMMQNDLMSKLANLQNPLKQSTDELGFPSRNSHMDSLTNLLEKAKDVTYGNKDKITAARKSSSMIPSTKKIGLKKQQQTGTFLTGVGLSVQPQQKPRQQKQNDAFKQLHRDYYSNPSAYQQEDPEDIIKQMIKKNGDDDLAQLRRMIKQTDMSLKDYGRQLHKTRKDVLGMADKFYDVDYNLMEKITRYGQHKY